MNHSNRAVTPFGRKKRTTIYALRHVRIVTDPQKLARLKAEAEKRNHMLELLALARKA